MRLAVLQPGYLPWAGYFEQLARADLFVHYDDVQYDKHGWRNRNRIRTSAKEGWSWLTVPVMTTGRFGQPIHQVEIDNKTRWTEKHWRSIEQSYRKAPHFAEHAPALQALYQREWRLLAELDLALIEVLAKAFGLEGVRTVRSSQLPEVPPMEDPTERLLALCRHFGATDYYSGAAAKAYLDVARFEAIGVRVEFQDYVHPVHAQAGHAEFVSHLAAIDLLFNAGPRSRELLAGGRP